MEEEGALGEVWFVQVTRVVPPATRVTQVGIYFLSRIFLEDNLGLKISPI